MIRINAGVRRVIKHSVSGHRPSKPSATDPHEAIKRNPIGASAMGRLGSPNQSLANLSLENPAPMAFRTKTTVTVIVSATKKVPKPQLREMLNVGLEKAETPERIVRRSAKAQ